jgi:two-component system, cell cycle sensor histidine kinase and response regulator CckA
MLINWGIAPAFSADSLFIFGSILFLLTIIGLWYLIGKESRKTLALREEINALKRVEEALVESERKYRELFELSPVGIFKTTSNGQALFVNPEMARIVGVNSTQEAVDKFQDLARDFYVDPDRRKEFIDLMRVNGAVENFEYEARRLDGKRIWLTMNARARGKSPDGSFIIDGFTMDITGPKKIQAEKEKLEIQLHQSQKMESIGTLAGGMAHDFNNLLMGIQGCASLMSVDLETSHPHLEHIRAIEEYIRSAANLTKQLLGFARGGKYEVKPIDMNELVLGSSAMFGRTRKEIRIHTKCQEASLVVEADRGQIEQVLLNMYVNAWQAMPPDGGRLYLETRIVTLDAAFCGPHRAKPGRYVKVSITDTGVGMDEATRLQIFDPFFTTKEKGRGTGLGLASAYGIIKNHGGMITVYSEIGHGTTFNIYLPETNKDVLSESSPENGLIRGSATILLVDDEEMIIEVGKAMLERMGYRVMVCRQGQAAVKEITERGNEIDLVILDLIMPGMDGGQTFDSIRRIRPEMPVLLSSGYAINGHANEIMQRGCNGFIQKPYNIAELSSKVRSVLDEKKAD